MIKMIFYLCFMNTTLNPFFTVGYHGPEFFCDREEETQQIIRLVKNGKHIALFAIRRIGKTGLIYHVFHPYANSKNVACIYLDILATKNLSDFINTMATAVYNRFPQKISIGKKIMDFIMRLRPTITFDELNGNPSLTLSLNNPRQKENTLEQILKFLDNQKIKIIFAIDEFQQILEYPEANTESLLRTHIQPLKNISFIFCGSNQKMMHHIFNSAKRPFFTICSNINLGTIDKGKYKTFIKRKFLQYKRKINDDCIDFICDWTYLHTFYTQYLCAELFAKNKKHNTLEDAKQTAAEILKMNENTFFQYKNLLTDAQWNLLRAIAHEEYLFKPQSKEFITKYQLGMPSAVKRSLDALLEKEMIYYQTSAEKPYYQVYDKFLLRWLKRH